MAFTLDDQPMIHLDAEALAELGIAEAYSRLLPDLQRYIAQPAPLEELIDEELPCYIVRCEGNEYVILGPEADEENSDSWMRATVAYFGIVNSQLTTTSHRLYAFGSGNDLGGLFLTQVQAAELRVTLPNPQDWPYLPMSEPPWYGQHHGAE